MTNLSEDELFAIFDNWWYGMKTLGYNTRDDKQAYDQIVALIKKPEVTEEWIEEKAKELHDKAYDAYPFIRSAVYWKDFIRSLVDSIEGGK